jgi:hypothetical protein
MTFRLPQIAVVWYFNGQTIMQPTYKVRGSDGNEYGPVSLEQTMSWLQEGRIDGRTELMRSDVDYWSPAESYTEFQNILATRAVVSDTPAADASPAAPADNTLRGDAESWEQMKSGASWFYWIAGLSIVNTVLAFSGSSMGFALGLGVTRIFDAFGHGLGGLGMIVALLLDLVAIGVFVLFGVFANKGHLWAFIVGMVLFALDGLIFLLVMDWIGIGFHVLALFFLFRGFQACRALRAG